MKQTSLLDSFIKKAKEKKDNQVTEASHKKGEQPGTHHKQNQGDNQQKLGPDRNSSQEEHEKPTGRKTKRKDEDFLPSSQGDSSGADSSFQEFSSDQDFENPKNDRQNGGKIKTQKNRQKKQTAKKTLPLVKNQSKNQESEVVYDETNIFNRSQFSDATPEWAIPGHPTCKDKNGHSPSSPNYDETTLYVPPDFLEQKTPPMRQFWKIKSENFDKIVLFKLGKFYELFYEDALIGNKHLDLKWMGSKMHTGFPEKCLQKYTTELIRLGFKVVVVEQMETPAQMEQRLKKEKELFKHDKKKIEKTLRREVTQICTRGTEVIPEEEGSYLPNYLVSVYRHNELIAYSLLDVGANSVLLGIVGSFEEFKTVLYQTRPSELLFDPDNLLFRVTETLRENMPGMVFSKLPNRDNLWHHLGFKNEMARLQEKGVLARPRVLDLVEEFEFVPKTLIMSTLSGLFEYLHRIHKFEYIVPTLRFRFYEKDKASSHLVLDSQALQHLEVFETSLGERGSLFEKVERTRTKFGKRMLRKWMMSPLVDPYRIGQRLDAVEDIRVLASEKNDIMKELSALPDLERAANKLSKYAIRNTSASEAVYFEDLPTLRLREFDQFMRSLERSLKIIAILDSHCSEFKSRRLRSLISPSEGQEGNQEKLIYFEDEEVQKGSGTVKGLLPDIVSTLKVFKQFVVWKGDKPYPKPGLVEEYDKVESEKQMVEKELEMELESIREHFNCAQISYVHTKERFEVEIPEKKSIKIPKAFTFSSKRSGFSRYLVPEVRELVEKLEEVEKLLKAQMNMFVRFFFEQFRERQQEWERYVNILAEIDCLTGMAHYSTQISGCRPCFPEGGYEVRQGYHPSLYSSSFVPNDISFHSPVVILTGPNMGGKSTTLRACCQLTIMAQMGSYVPAESYRAAIVDRIFTRIGASDKLEAGKSTFFIEMEETESILSHATARSLAIVDELGRGTATYDGMAIARSVLNFLIEEIGCKCLFATHYHSLTEEFAARSGTCLKMMDYRLFREQSGEESVEFLYKLVEGKAEKSFGLNVARMVGLPDELIREATAKSEEMHWVIEHKKVNAKAHLLQRRIKNLLEKPITTNEG